jgi:hypothetical protein
VSSRKSKKGKRAGICLGCGKTLRERMRKCPRCGRLSPLYAPKVAQGPAFIAKSAGRASVTPILAAKSARPVCHCGHQGKRTARYCTSCGLPFGISKVAVEGAALKAAGIVPGGHWGAQAARETDPAQRELMRGMATKAGRQPSAEDIARAWGYPDLRTAALYCDQPEARSFFSTAYFNGGQPA